MRNEDNQCFCHVYALPNESQRLDGTLLTFSPLTWATLYEAVLSTLHGAASTTVSHDILSRLVP